MSTAERFVGDGGDMTSAFASGAPGVIRTARAMWLELSALTTLCISLIVRLATTWSRPYPGDDFYFSYTAWLRSGPGIPHRDYYMPNFTPLAELAAPLYAAFPESFVPLEICRTIIFVVGVALVWAVYQMTLALGASRAWALIAANVLSWQKDFTLRIGDIRSDQVAALMLVIATVILLRRPKTILTAVQVGLFLGAAIALTYKLGLAAPFFGFAVLLDRKPRWFARAFVLTVTTMVPPVAYFGWRLYADGLEAFKITWSEILSAVADGFGYRREAFISALNGAEIAVLSIVGGAIMLLVVKDQPMRRTRFLYALAVLTFLTIYVAINPFIYPYNFVILVPFLAPLVIGIDLLPSTPRTRKPLAACILLAAVSGGFWATMTTIRSDNEFQHRMVKWVWKATAPDEAVFDWEGLHLWRRGVYHWWHYAGFQPQYARGERFRIADELREAQVTVMIKSPRFRGFTKYDRRFVDDHYITLDTCMWVPGWSFTRSEVARGTTFHAFLREGEYRLVRPPRGRLRGVFIDGQPLGERVRLREGYHRIHAAPGTPLPYAVALQFTSPRRESVKVPCDQRGVLELNLSKNGPQKF